MKRQLKLDPAQAFNAWVFRLQCFTEPPRKVEVIKKTPGWIWTRGLYGLTSNPIDQHQIREELGGRINTPYWAIFTNEEAAKTCFVRTLEDEITKTRVHLRQALKILRSLNPSSLALIDPENNGGGSTPDVILNARSKKSRKPTGIK